MQRKNSDQKLKATQYLNDYEKMVFRIVHSYQRTTGKPFEELLSAGYEGFVQACQNYSSESGTAFSTCAWTYIQNAINDFLNQSKKWIEGSAEIETKTTIDASSMTFFQDKINQLGQDAQNICQVLFTIPDEHKPENRTQLKQEARMHGMPWPKIWKGMHELREFCRN